MKNVLKCSALLWPHLSLGVNYTIQVHWTRMVNNTRYPYTVGPAYNEFVVTEICNIAVNDFVAIVTNIMPG